MSGMKSVTTLTVVLSVFGGVALLGAGATAAVAGVHWIGPQSGEITLDARGISGLDLEVRGAEVEVEFHDGDRAELRIEGGSPNGWSMRRDDDELEVRGPERGFRWWTPDWVRGEERVTLLLPRESEGLDADLTLDAGALTVDGAFGDLEVQMGAGMLSLRGSADALDAQLSAGRADIAVDGVDEASFELAAGRVDAELNGAAPREVDIDVSAGQLTLVLPDAAYDLRRNVSAGRIESSLTEDAQSANTVLARVSAGTVVLRSE